MDRNSLNGHDHGDKPPSQLRNGRPGIRGTEQAAFVQRLLFDSLRAMREANTDSETGKLVIDTKTAVALNRLALAWDKASDRLRIMRGRGLPASERRKARQVGAVQPLDPA